MKYLRTSDLAKAVGVHPNTVRRYASDRWISTLIDQEQRALTIIALVEEIIQKQTRSLQPSDCAAVAP